MPGFKLSKIVTQTGTQAGYEPIQISIALTPEQRRMIGQATGQYPQKLELTARELRLILVPGLSRAKDW